MDLGLSGLASGLDWRTLVDQLAEVERAPQKTLLTEQTTINQRNNAYSSIKTQLGVLNNRITTLKDPAFFDSRLARVSDSTIASATVVAGAAAGQYAFTISQMATTARQNGAVNAGGKISATNDVSGLTLSAAGFSTAVTAGVITVNGKQVTLATTDTLQDVFNNISSATGGAVTGSYDASTDKISFQSSSGEVVLGSATDTSNFFAVTRLTNNGTNTVSSSSSVGGLRLTGKLSQANFGTALTDGGSGAGSFKINGVAISFNTATDSLTNVLDRINSSAAGVTANYDAVNDRLTLANKVTGDLGVAMEDVTGNFLAASGLSSGTLERGKNLIYKVNGGPDLVSQTNTITESSSGLTGVSLTALKEGSITLSVTTDTSKIKTAITDFISEYNRAQSLISTQTASTTDAKGKVTAGILANESMADDIASRLRTGTNSLVSGLSGVFKRLDDLGIKTNGNDDTITLSDSTALDTALADHLADVKSLFTDSSNGIATRLNSLMDKTIGENGSLITKQDNLTKQSSGIDTQVSTLERVVLSNRQRLIDSFVSMETAQSNIKQQLAYLTKNFGS
jgi:flagellar hook-associated protein 2